jgi:hypothetical protein
MEEQAVTQTIMYEDGELLLRGSAGAFGGGAPCRRNYTCDPSSVLFGSALSSTCIPSTLESDGYLVTKDPHNTGSTFEASLPS